MKKRILAFNLMCIMIISIINVPIYAQAKLHDLDDMIESYPVEISSIEVDLKNETVQIDNKPIKTNDLEEEYLDEDSLFSDKNTVEECLQSAGYGNIEWDGKTVTADNEFSSGRLILMETTLPNDEYGAKMVSKSYSGYILQYDTPKEAYEAYNELKERGLNVMPSVLVRMTETSLDKDASLSQIKSYYLDSWTSTIGLDQLQEDKNYQTTEVVVGVIDSGVNEVFGDANSRILTRENLTAESTCVDNNGHGTFVTSIVLDNSAENVKIRSYKVFSTDGNGTDSVMIENALYKAYEDGCDVINMSLGFDNEDESLDANGNVIKYGLGTYYDALFQLLQKNNSIAVVSSGNAGHSTDFCYPAGSKYVWTVGSVNSEKVISDYSNYGKIDFVTKGYSVTGITNSGSTGRASGTSMSTPFITAMVAQLKGSATPMSITEEYDYLKSICEDLGEKGYDNYYGYGLPIYPSTEPKECNHSWMTTKIIEGTCIREEEHQYLCSLCNETKTEKKGLSPNAHKNISCVIKEATCTQLGSKTYTCSDCHKTIKTESINLAEHNYVISESSVANTCNQISVCYTCVACGHSYTETIGSASHQYNVMETKEATCNENGYIIYECAGCQNQYTETLKQLTHSYKVTDTQTSNICNAVTTTYTCNNCGHSYVESSGSSTHQYELIDSKESTCYQNGYRTYKCTACEHEYTETINKLSHSYTKDITEATCIIAKKTTYTCKNCSNTYTVTGSTNKSNHKHTTTKTTDATCSATGFKKTICEDCDTVISTTVLEKKKHDYQINRTEPTCTQNGSEIKTCKSCGETVISTIATHGHDYITKESSPATCKADGFTKQVCSHCGDENNQIIEKTKHNYKLIKSVKSTCTSAGSETYRCTGCMDEYSKEIKIKEHTIITESQNATSNTNGYIKTVCKTCGTVLTETVLPATGKTSVKITLNPNGGTCTKKYVTAETGKTVTLPVPIRKGYVFKGWYINDKPLKEYIITNDCTAIAKWTKIQLKKSKITKIKNKKVTFKKISGSDGYQVQYSTSKKFKKKYTLTTKKTNVKLNRLKKGMYIRIRAYKKDSAGKLVYGKWYTKKYK